MKLDRNLDGNQQRGKYALLKLRQVKNYIPSEPFEGNPVLDAIKLLEDEGILDWGTAGTESEFFVIRLKDKYAQAALIAYASLAYHDDEEWAAEVRELAFRAGHDNPHCQRPD